MSRKARPVRQVGDERPLPPHPLCRQPAICRNAPGCALDPLCALREAEIIFASLGDMALLRRVREMTAAAEKRFQQHRELFR
jgi:hypothetical protein